VRSSLPSFLYASRSSRRPWQCSTSTARAPCRCGAWPTASASLNALYTHVRSKADLIDGLIDQIYAGLDLDPDPTGDWTDQLASMSEAVRAHLLAHPAVVPLALQQPGLGPNALRLGEAIYCVLRAAGFSDQAVVGTVYALLTYILGFVALEIPRAGTDPQTSDEFVRRLHAFFAALPPGAFPHTVELAPLLARISTDDQYRFGIRTFLAGLAARQPELRHRAVRNDPQT
jgi:AcrR family transcriptional regulator